MGLRMKELLTFVFFETKGENGIIRVVFDTFFYWELPFWV